MNKHNINSQHLKYQCLFHVGFNNTWLRNLDISFTNFKYLPDNLTIQGSLEIDQSSLELPINLKVGGYLYIKNAAIEQLPNNIKVGGTIWTENSKLPIHTTMHQSTQNLPQTHINTSSVTVRGIHR